MSGKEEWYLPLSPPFAETAEGLIDVSKFAEASSNMIRLVQTCDMSDFVFVLHVHPPTPSQMEEENTRREKEQAWRDDLKRWAQPPAVPFLWGEKAVLLR
ncbi:hypothetical protein FIBSPDRAFT_861452 [Athelia psychrophila]|uniref:Uncharacterized protein n=1 Tax=Athelia psychrophila TaxID=1759441 RepID=A0A166JCD5_9AGAM|nr:hypothetical protein FIBSPDRAFT_861452 [Fibularhizoctonia sp. CBS 109695]